MFKRILCRLFGHPLIRQSGSWQCRRCGHVYRGNVVPTDRVTPKAPLRETGLSQWEYRGEPWERDSTVQVDGITVSERDRPAPWADPPPPPEPATFHFKVDEDGAKFLGCRDANGRFMKADPPVREIHEVDLHEVSITADGLDAGYTVKREGDDDGG